MKNAKNLNRSDDQRQSSKDTERIHQRMNEVHRLMEQLEDRVLFDAVADPTLLLGQDPLDQSFHPAVSIGDAEETTQQLARNEIVFIDPSVEGADQLLADLLERRADQALEVRLLNPDSDGVEQIAAALTGRDDIDAIHLISHGNAGALQLGSAVLDVDAMSQRYTEELAVINAALREEADLLVYGCNFGEGEAGRAAVEQLAHYTGADVAASTDETGIKFRGGDWYLEYTTGNIQSEIIVSVELQQHWNVILGTPAMEFYVTLDEQGIYDANEKILNEGAFGNVSQQVISTIGIVANNDNTIIYYDHHEDGYEADLDAPVQSTTEVWGDGDVSNGAAPGVTLDADDVLNAGGLCCLAEHRRPDQSAVTDKYSVRRDGPFCFR